MKKSELIERIKSKYKLKSSSKNDSALPVKEAVDLIIEDMFNCLACYKRIEIRGFGSFAVRHYHKNKLFRNPKTDETWEAVQRSRVRFRAGKDLKGGVDR